MNGTPDDDVILRAFGFRVFSRPKEGDVVWKRGPKSYTYVAAMEECAVILAKRAEQLKQGISF